MMMPANFSAVAENEMTYVVGGGLVDVLAPVMNEGNWQNLNYNLIQIVGNTFLGNNVGKAFGAIFSGNYHVGQVTESAFKTLAKVWDTNYQAGKADWALGNALLNTGLMVAGTLASVYTLGSGKIGIEAGKKFDAADIAKNATGLKV